jgi:hypothetical protein
MLSPHQMGGGGIEQGNLLTIHKMISVKKARTNPQPNNKTGTGNVCSLLN